MNDVPRYWVTAEGLPPIGCDTAAEVLALVAEFRRRDARERRASLPRRPRTNTRRNEWLRRHWLKRFAPIRDTQFQDGSQGMG